MPDGDRPFEPVADVGAGRALRRLGAQLRKALLRFRLGEHWVESEDGFAQRVYPSYALYLEHQKTKFDAARGRSVRGHDARFHDALAGRLRDCSLEIAGRSVLCLGARQGTEVRTFIDVGAFAAGIDLNPGRGNQYVVVGDFQALQFADRSVDIVYTNSLDHAIDIDDVLSEIGRVLKADGALIAELNSGDGGSDTGFYESFGWTTVDAMVERLGRHGFSPDQRTPFDVPWPGEMLVLRRAGQPGPIAEGN